MPKPRSFHVLVATDGSSSATAALRAALHFPWPEASTASGLVVREVRTDIRSSVLLTALDRGAGETAASAQKVLARRWPGAQVHVARGPVVGTIVSEATRRAAAAVVVGWRGHGAFGRLLVGSVSRGVARQAPSAVLVVKGRTRPIDRVVVGVDGSAGARNAVALLARCPVPRAGRIWLVTALDLMRPPSHALLAPSTRAAVAAEVTRLNRRREARATKELERAAATLTRAGWQVATSVFRGPALDAVLDAISQHRANLLVLGARGTSGLKRLLLGSVAEGALSRCPVPVLLAR